MANPTRQTETKSAEKWLKTSRVRLAVNQIMNKAAVTKIGEMRVSVLKSGCQLNRFSIASIDIRDKASNTVPTIQPAVRAADAATLLRVNFTQYLLCLLGLLGSYNGNPCFPEIIGTQHGRDDLVISRLKVGDKFVPSDIFIAEGKIGFITPPVRRLVAYTFPPMYAIEPGKDTVPPITSSDAVVEKLTAVVGVSMLIFGYSASSSQADRRTHKENNRIKDLMGGFISCLIRFVSH